MKDLFNGLAILSYLATHVGFISFAFTGSQTAVLIGVLGLYGVNTFGGLAQYIEYKERQKALLDAVMSTLDKPNEQANNN
jgi:hypothetical protein